MKCEGSYAGEECPLDATHVIFDPETVEQYGDDEKTYVCEHHLDERRSLYGLNPEDVVEPVRT